MKGKFFHFMKCMLRPKKTPALAVSNDSDSDFIIVWDLAVKVRFGDFSNVRAFSFIAQVIFLAPKPERSQMELRYDKSSSTIC